VNLLEIEKKMSKTAAKNLLNKEISPYLKQRSSDSIHWSAWNEFGIDNAIMLEKPILILVGKQSATPCHHLHKELEESKETSSFINEKFTPFLIDADDSPTIAKYFRTVSRSLSTKLFSYPLWVILAPNKKPVFAESISENSQLLPALKKISQNWVENPSKLQTIAQKNEQKILTSQNIIFKNEFSKSSISQATKILEQKFDRKLGLNDNQFYNANPAQLLFLLRSFYWTGNKAHLGMVFRTLDQIIQSPLQDHTSGGFFDYSQTKDWKTPVLVKSLNNNSLLLTLFCEAWQITCSESFKEAALGICHFLFDKLENQEDWGFYSSFNSESQEEALNYYSWTEQKLEDILGEEDSQQFLKYYKLNPKENKEAGGVLFLRDSIENLSKLAGLQRKELAKWIHDKLRKLNRSREKNNNSININKNMTSEGNGLALAAFSIASRTLDRSELKLTARKIAFFLNKYLINKNSLQHSWQNGKINEKTYLRDFSHTIWGLLELYQTTWDHTYLEQVIFLSKNVSENYWNPDLGGFNTCPHSDTLNPNLIRDFDDNEDISGNGLLAWCWVRLSKITSDPQWQQYAKDILDSAGDQSFVSRGGIFTAAIHYFNSSIEILITGSLNHKLSQELKRQTKRHFKPNLVLIYKGEYQGEKINSICPRISEFSHQEDALYCTKNSSDRESILNLAMLKQIFLP
jgi:uncharacterized protein